MLGLRYMRVVLLGVTVAVCTAALVGQAHAASLTGDAARLEEAWARNAKRYVRLAPRFLMTDRREFFLVPAWALEPSDGCATVAVLGTRSSDFSVLLGVGADAPRYRSAAGVVAVTRCGATRPELQHVMLHMHASRGTLEALITLTDRPPAPVERVLAERAAGPLPPPVPQLQAPSAAPLAERQAEREASYRRDGAATVGSRTMPSAWQGRGHVVLPLIPGCHRLALLARPAAQQRADLDAELRDGADGAILARDRSFAPDADLAACVGTSIAGHVHWTGAGDDATVTLLHAYFPIPRGIPQDWPSRARAGLWQALLARNGPGLREEPQWQVVGVMGSTILPLELAPGACYLLGVGLFRGEPHTTRVAIETGASRVMDATTAGAQGAAAYFCTGARQGRAEVTVFGRNVLWIAGLWHLGAVALGSQEKP